MPLQNPVQSIQQTTISDALQFWNDHKEIRNNSSKMYECLGKLQEVIKAFCDNRGKQWNRTESELIARIQNIWDPLEVAYVCYLTKRSPYSIFNNYVYTAWNEAEYRNDFSMFEKMLKSLPK